MDNLGVEGDSPIFCFHSVRSRLAIPDGRLWSNTATAYEFCKYLTVNPEWYYRWVSSAKEIWPNMKVSFDDAFRDVVIPALKTVHKFKVEVIIFVPVGHIARGFPYAPYDVICESEIEYLYRNGVQIGSHGYRHEDLRVYPEEILEVDFKVAGSILAKYCGGIFPAMIAPPHGRISEDLVMAAYAVGHECVYGTHLDRAGEIDGTVLRHQANMDGYVDMHGNERAWPWII